MSYWLYSVESFPNAELQGKSGYSPEYLMHAGIQLTLQAKTWTKLPDRFSSVRHKDWANRAGERYIVTVEDIIKPLEARFASRGVIFLDHEPSAAEKAKYEKEAHEVNLAHRMAAVEWYENQRHEKEVTGQGRTRPTPYEDQCYQILGLTKPYSVEAMRAQRHPGEAVGEQIVAALERLDARRVSEAKQPSVSKS